MIISQNAKQDSASQFLRIIPQIILSEPEPDQQISQQQRGLFLYDG